MNEVTTHAQGMDLEGNVGQAIFAVQPEADVFYGAAAGRIEATVTAANDPSVDGKALLLQFYAGRDQWFAMDAQGRRIAAQGAATTLVIDDIEVQSVALPKMAIRSRSVCVRTLPTRCT